MDYTLLDFSRLTGIPPTVADPVGAARRQLAMFLADPLQTPSEVAGEAALRDYLAGTATIIGYKSVDEYYADAAQSRGGFDFFRSSNVTLPTLTTGAGVQPDWVRYAVPVGAGLALAWWLA